MKPLTLIILLTALLAPSASNARSAKKPNIVFVLADDLGWRDVGFHGARFAETPNFVAPDGDDAASGRASSPFRTIRRALEVAAGRPAATIVLRPGEYDIARTLDITEAHAGLTIRAAKAGTVTLRGGLRLTATAFRAVTDDRILRRLIDPEARKRLLSASLARLGLREIDAPVGRGFHLPRRPGPVELFIEDRPMTIARWPNDGFLKTGKLTNGDTDHPTIALATDRLQHWRTAEEPWVFGYWRWDWADESLPIRLIAAAKNTITLAGKHRYGVREGREFWVENLLEEIDRAGEYYVHRSSGLLFLYPPEGFRDAKIEVSTVKEPLIRIRGAKDVTLEGLIIGPTRGTGVRVDGGENITIAGCRVHNAGQTGVVLMHGSAHRLQSCEIFNTGEGGSVVTAGTRATLTPGKVTVDNCHYKNFSRRTMTYRPAISLNGVGNVITHNLMEDAPHSALIFGGNDHLIEFNEVRNVLANTGDGGAFYTGRDWSTRGTIIRHNAFYDLVGIGKWENAVYIDDMACGTTIEGNLFVNCHWASLLGGGRDLKFVNNVVVDNKLAVHLDARMLGWASPHMELMTGRLEAMPYREKPWCDRYPELLTLLQDDPATPKHNLLERNLLVNSGRIDQDIAPQARAHGMIRNNWSTASDPGFVDMAKRDFRFKPNALVLEKIRGFKVIPVEKMGRYPDRWVKK